jgi:predicted rRNA methylase YqxC with S4 and FtsJ domains
LNDVVGELISVFKYFQRSSLTALEAVQSAEVKVNKLRVQNLGEHVHWNDEVISVLLAANRDVGSCSP